MRHPRRQGHAGFASVTGTVVSTPEGASATSPRRPALRLPGAATRPCWIQVPVRSLACRTMLAHPLPPKASAAACAALPPEAPVRFRDPSARRLRSRLRVSLGWSASATACAAPSASRSSPGYPRSGFPPPPEGDLGLPDRVSSSLCFGFPRRRFLLTVVRLSPIPDSGKREMGHQPC